VPHATEASSAHSLVAQVIEVSKPGSVV
jgi:hypothetical protein